MKLEIFCRYSFLLPGRPKDLSAPLFKISCICGNDDAHSESKVFNE